MGWKGDPCWYCRADLHAIEEQDPVVSVDPDGWVLNRYENDDPRSFAWHMDGNCLGNYYILIRDGAELRIKSPAVEYP